MRSPPRLASIRVRITVFAGCAVGIALLIGSFVLLGLLRSALLRSQAGSGPHRAAELAALASRGPLPDPLPRVDTVRLTLLQILDANGKVVAASSELRSHPALMGPTRRHRQVLSEVAGLKGGPWLAEPTPATVGGRATTVIVLTSLEEYSRSAQLLRVSLFVSVPILVALVSVVVWLVVGRALGPVESMRAEVTRITARRLDRRVAPPTNDDEVGRLARTLNDMLDRLQHARDAQHRFVADASHELRTPIANARTALEIAALHPEATQWPALVTELQAQNARMERLTDDLLLMARADADVVAVTRVDTPLAELVRREVNRALPAGKTISVVEPLPSVTIMADPDQLAQILANLIDNAVRHATRRVKVSLSAGSSWVEIKVSDDGPGIAPAARETVFAPFVRLDEHRTRQSGGAGLGLAIVRQLVVAHHGTVKIDGSEPGATFVVRLPR